MGGRGEQRQKEREVYRGARLLAKHPDARPGPLPAGMKSSLLAPQSSRLCGDSDLSLHLEGQHHPIAIRLNLNNLVPTAQLL